MAKKALATLGITYSSHLKQFWSKQLWSQIFPGFEKQEVTGQGWRGRGDSWGLGNQKEGQERQEQTSAPDPGRPHWAVQTNKDGVVHVLLEEGIKVLTV